MCWTSTGSIHHIYRNLRCLNLKKEDDVYVWVKVGLYFRITNINEILEQESNFSGTEKDMREGKTNCSGSWACNLKARGAAEARI